MPSVRLAGISKSFGAVQALQAVDFFAESGTITALVGENGAGKTTLMRVLYGTVKPDEGNLEIDGGSFSPKNAAEAIDHGIGMVNQHYAIIPGLTVLQNLMLGAEHSSWLNMQKARVEAQELAARMEFAFDWDEDADLLSPASAQKLEILKLLWRKAKIMILDEPTAMLSPLDGDALFRSLRKLSSEGVTIIIVTHRLSEVMENAGRVWVLRGGRLVMHSEVSATDERALAREIVGGELAPPPPPESASTTHSILSIKEFEITVHFKSQKIDLEVKSGEMVGIAGVDGSGQQQLFHRLLGLENGSGSILLAGEDGSKWTTAQRLQWGMRDIAEDRLLEAVVPEWSLELNGALGLQRLKDLRSGMYVDAGKRHELAVQLAERFKTKHGGLNLPMESLSGGNQQRFVAARSLALEPRLILAFQPARGLDLKGARAVFDGIREACRAGAGALIVSFDLDELLTYCDRIVTMFDGRITSTPQGHERDREMIGRQMVGIS